MSIIELEQRVATLELKLQHLTEKVAATDSQDINAWIDEIHGTFKNDTTYRKAARFGREWRMAQRPPKPRSRKAPSK